MCSGVARGWLGGAVARAHPDDDAGMGWCGGDGRVARTRAEASRTRCGRSACLRKLGDGARAADADSSMQQPGTLCYRLTVPLEATQSRQHELRSHPPTCCRPYFTSLTTILRTPMHMALRNPLSRTVFSAVCGPGRRYKGARRRSAPKPA